MRDVGLGAAIVPPFPGVTSALGCVVADMRHDRVQTVNRLLSELDCAAMEREMRAAADETEALLARAGVGFERIEQADATIFIDPGLAGRVDAFGNVIIRRSDDAAL